MSRLFADVKCACGLPVRVEFEGRDTAAPGMPCVCGKGTCVHELIECSDCSLPTGRCCRTEYAGRVLCRDCIAAEVADGAEEIAEVVA